MSHIRRININYVWYIHAYIHPSIFILIVMMISICERNGLTVMMWGVDVTSHIQPIFKM